MSSTTTQRLAPDLWRLAAGLAGVAAVTVVYRQWVPLPNATTVSLTLLVVVLVVAATSRLWTAVVTSVVALLAFNFFFLPPVGTLTIADPQNWVALFAFLAVSLNSVRRSSGTPEPFPTPKLPAERAWPCSCRLQGLTRPTCLPTRPSVFLQTSR